MSTQKISSGTVHKLPKDLEIALASDKATLSAWENISPLARNEWICWVTSPVKQETRNDHVKRMTEELREGKRRPCCWAGCIHR